MIVDSFNLGLSLSVDSLAAATNKLDVHSVHYINCRLWSASNMLTAYHKMN